MLPSELPQHVERPSIDTETSGLFPDDGARVAVVSVGWHDGEQIVGHAFPFCQEPNREDGLPEFNLPRSEWDALCEWLRTRDGLVMHNALFDSILMGAGTGNGFPGVDLLDLVCWDSMLVQHLLDPGEKASLDETAKRLFDVETKGEWVKAIKSDLRRKKQKLFRYDLADWDLVRPYATLDAELTIRLARMQWGRLREGEARFDQVHHDLEIMRVLARMERRGLPYDADRSLQVAAALAKQRVELRKQLPFVPKLANMKQWFFDLHGFEPIKQTPGGADSLDAETIEHLAAEGAPAADVLLRYKKVDLAEIRWYRGFAVQVGADGRLRPRFRQTSVRSGRLSIERVQLQAIPHDYQLAKSPDLSKHPFPRQLVPDPPGWRIWEMDLAQAELRVAAWIAKCEPMLKLIREKRDPHGELATEVFGVRSGDDDWGKYRQVGKRANFSLIFAIGAPKLRVDIRQQTGTDLGDQETRRLRDTWLEMYPEFGRAIRAHQWQAQQSHRVRLINGRWNYFQAWESLHKAFNRRVQGSIGEFAKTWMVDVDRMLRDALPDHPEMGLLLQIHDSLVVCVPADQDETLVAKCVELGVDLWHAWFTNKQVDDDGQSYTHMVPGEVESKPWTRLAS